jgi:hypothetical protein
LPAERSYAHRSLIDKLGIKPEHRVCLRAITDPRFVKLVEAHVKTPPSHSARGRYDIIIFEVNAERDLNQIALLGKHLVPSGGLWILHPKGKGASPRDSQVRAGGIAAGLVDNKICAYSETHTATRYVIPRADRPSGRTPQIRR